MLNLRFRLNNRPTSDLFVEGVGNFSAFSGNGDFRNKVSAQCMENIGPLPIGKYYVFDRETGGRLGWLYNLTGRYDDWFALYAIDGKIDDITWCNKVQRGNFRLHHGGNSDGCITVVDAAQYKLLHNRIKAHGASTVSGSDLLAYGILEVTA